MNLLTVSPSPHIRSERTTQSIMLDVIIALCPAWIASVIIFGWRALLVSVVCIVSCGAPEYLCRRAMKREQTGGDLSAVVTGLLLALNLPVTIPLWVAVFGCFIAIAVTKQLFGGIGQNFANPAITARVVLLASFGGYMTKFTAPFDYGADAVSTSTPLQQLASDGGELPSLLQMFLGVKAGSMGEVSALALLIGFAYLLIRKVISWHTTVVYVGVVFLLSWPLGGSAYYALCQILSGGLLLGAIFMATDYATTPSTNWGRVLFGLGCGLFTVLIRQWGSYAEGVSFAILFMNILTPYLSKWTRSRPLGGAAK